MSGAVLPADGEVETFMEVKRATGAVTHYRVTNGETIPITIDEYTTATQEG